MYHHHDELLFIIQHQTSELRLKLILYERNVAIHYIVGDKLDPCLNILAQVKLIQRQLIEQWAVLETLAPSEYAKFRNVLQQASGMHSLQFRSLEFILGNKDKQVLKYYDKNSIDFVALQKILSSPNIYEEFLLYLHRENYGIPKECVDRN